MDLKVEELFYTYPGSEKPVLRGLSAMLAEGEITALTGMNGCGKTTLLKNIVGILKPDSGRILLGDQELTAFTIAMIGREIGCLLQNPSCQLFCTTVEEEMAYGLRNLGCSQAEIEEKTSYYLDYFQLSHYRKQFPHHLSQGEKQRLVLAAVLAMEPGFVLLDEPTSSLDVFRRRLLGNYLLNMKANGKGVVLISHDMEFIERYADRVLTLDEGVIAEIRRRSKTGRAENGCIT